MIGDRGRDTSYLMLPATDTLHHRLLMRGHSRGEARNAIRDALDRVLESWRCPAS